MPSAGPPAGRGSPGRKPRNRAAPGAVPVAAVRGRGCGDPHGTTVTARTPGGQGRRSRGRGSIGPCPAAGPAATLEPVEEQPMRATVSMTLDLRGLADPLLVARTGVAMAGLRSGELIEVLTTDRDSVRDLTVWARASGNRLVEQTEWRDIYRFLFRKR